MGSAGVTGAGVSLGAVVIGGMGSLGLTGGAGGVAQALRNSKTSNMILLLMGVDSLGVES